MSSADLRSQVKEVLAREWNLVPGAIPDDAAINDLTQWDSLGHITIMLALEADFGVEITADTVQSLLSVPKIVEYLEALRASGGHA